LDGVPSGSDILESRVVVRHPNSSNVEPREARMRSRRRSREQRLCTAWLDCSKSHGDRPSTSLTVFSIKRSKSLVQRIEPVELCARSLKDSCDGQSEPHVSVCKLFRSSVEVGKCRNRLLQSVQENSRIFYLCKRPETGENQLRKIAGFSMPEANFPTRVKPTNAWIGGRLSETTVSSCPLKINDAKRLSLSSVSIPKKLSQVVPFGDVHGIVGHRTVSRNSELPSLAPEKPLIPRRPKRNLSASPHISADDD